MNILCKIAVHDHGDPRRFLILRYDSHIPLENEAHYIFLWFLYPVPTIFAIVRPTYIADKIGCVRMIVNNTLIYFDPSQPSLYRLMMLFNFIYYLFAGLRCWKCQNMDVTTCLKHGKVQKCKKNEKVWNCENWFLGRFEFTRKFVFRPARHGSKC